MAGEVKTLQLSGGVDVTPPTDLTLAGGGGGGLTNFNENPNASVAIDNNGTNDVGDYIDSSTGVVSSRTTTEAEIPLFGPFETGVLLTFASGTSDYTGLRFRIPPGGRNTKLYGFWYQVCSGYTTQTANFELYSYSDAYSTGETEVTLSTDDSSGDSLIPNYDGKIAFAFDADGREYYELRWINNGATSGTIGMNNVTITPSPIAVQGSIVGGWETSSLTSSISTNVTTTSYMRRVGENAEFLINQDFSGVTDNTEITFDLPSGMTINTTLMDTANVRTNPLGIVTMWDSTTTYPGRICVEDSNTVRAFRFFDSSGETRQGTVNLGSGASPFQSASGDNLYAYFTVPIAEWAGSGKANLQGNEVEYAYNSSTSTTSDTTSFAYGPGGKEVESFAAAATSAITKRVRFQTPIQPTDIISIQFDRSNRGSWITVGDSLFSHHRDDDGGGSDYYGVSGFGVSGSDTDFDVFFYSDPFLDGSWATEESNGTRWRVVKHKAGIPVGFGQATVNSTGLAGKHTNWIDVSSEFSSTPTGWSVNFAEARAHSDFAGNWSVDLILDASISSASGTVSTTFDGISPSSTQALATYPQASNNANARIQTDSTIDVFDSGSRTGFVVSGTFRVDSKPTWAV